MNVALARRPNALFDAVFADDDFQTLSALFLAERVIRGLIVTAIRDYMEAPTITFLNFARLWARQQQANGEDDLPHGVEEAGRLLDNLYARHGSPNADNLRGAMLEGLVRDSLRRRYGDHQLDDNVVVTVTNGIHYQSPSERPVDVAGWDPTTERGECHDVKMKPQFLDETLVDDLARGLPQPEFKVGVVTANSDLTARAILTHKKGYQVPANVTLIAAERLLDFVPLQHIVIHGS